MAVPFARLVGFILVICVGPTIHQVVLTLWLISVNESRKVHRNPLTVIENVRNFQFCGPRDCFQCQTQNSICPTDHRIRWTASPWLNKEHQLKPVLFYPKAITSFNSKAQRLFFVYATGFKVIMVFTGSTQMRLEMTEPAGLILCVEDYSPEHKMILKYQQGVD